MNIGLDATINTLETPEIFGVYELDPNGVVLYSRNAAGQPSNSRSAQIGRNFFDDLTAFENAADLHSRLRSFIRNHNSVESFAFVCLTAQTAIRARVLLVRISERSEFGRTKSIIIDIRQD